MSQHESPPPGGTSDDVLKGAPNPEASGEPPSGSSGQPGSGDAGPQAIPLAALSASDLLAWVMSLLAAKAWEGMGLVASPVTSKVEKNMDEARLAIDAFAAVFAVVRTRIEEPAQREMENVLTTLRLNFVEKSAG
jgi:hypothetical protein